MSPLRLALILLFGFVCVTSIAGGIGFIVTNGLGLPIQWLIGTPFVSYLWPGIILAVVVGGTHLLATVFLLRSHSLAYEISAVAGFGLLIWVYVQLYILQRSYYLQTIFFSIGILELLILFILLRSQKNMS